MSDQVVVYVTRESDRSLELLVYETSGGKDVDMATHVPVAHLLPGEHPAEAALRCITELSGYDVFFTFRRLMAANGSHFYQTSPEVELPNDFHRAEPKDGSTRRFYWLREADVARRLAPVYGAGLARLLGEDA